MTPASPHSPAKCRFKKESAFLHHMLDQQRTQRNAELPKPPIRDHVGWKHGMPRLSNTLSFGYPRQPQKTDFLPGWIEAKQKNGFVFLNAESGRHTIAPAAHEPSGRHTHPVPSGAFGASHPAAPTQVLQGHPHLHRAHTVLAHRVLDPIRGGHHDHPRIRSTSGLESPVRTGTEAQLLNRVHYKKGTTFSAWTQIKHIPPPPPMAGPKGLRLCPTTLPGMGGTRIDIEPVRLPMPTDRFWDNCNAMDVFA